METESKSGLGLLLWAWADSMNRDCWIRRIILLIITFCVFSLGKYWYGVYLALSYTSRFCLVLWLRNYRGNSFKTWFCIARLVLTRIITKKDIDEYIQAADTSLDITTKEGCVMAIKAWQNSIAMKEPLFTLSIFLSS